jgi:hypothetical protein
MTVKEQLDDVIKWSNLKEVTEQCHRDGISMCISYGKFHGSGLYEFKGNTYGSARGIAEVFANLLDQVLQSMDDRHAKVVMGAVGSIFMEYAERYGDLDDDEEDQDGLCDNN